MSKVTVIDIAKKAGLSQGAVSKALGGKKGVSEQTRQLVIETAKEMGYEVNTLAQGLSRRVITIGIIMPDVWKEYYDEFIKGINKSLKNLNVYNVTGKYKYVSGLFSSDGIVKALDEFAEEEVDGVILCPASVTKLGAYTSYYKEKNIPILLLGTDLEIPEKICSVELDAVLAGKIAGEFLSLIMKKDENILAFVGNKDMEEHKNKLIGFREELKRQGLKVHSVYETQDDPELAYILAKSILEKVPNVGGIYIATINSVNICKAIKELGLDNKIKVIATDVFPEIKEFMDKGIIKGVVYQNPIKQGELAVLNIYRSLSERVSCKDRVLVNPGLVLSSNFSKYYT